MTAPRVLDVPLVGRALAGVRWYLREATGAARWDAYVDQCRREGREPMTRRQWERHRADLREHHPASRGC